MFIDFGYHYNLQYNVPSLPEDKAQIVSKLCKNYPSEIIKMREMRGEVGEKVGV